MKSSLLVLLALVTGVTLVCSMDTCESLESLASDLPPGKS